MIKNNRQLEYTKKRIREFEKDLAMIRKKYSSEKNKEKLLSQGYKEHIVQMKAEIEQYEKMKEAPLPKVLHAHNPVEISRLLVRLRLARGLTQEQLAARLGCTQSDISRLEREDYVGYTFSTLEKVASILNADLELNLMPA